MNSPHSLERFPAPLKASLSFLSNRPERLFFLVSALVFSFFSYGPWEIPGDGRGAAGLFFLCLGLGLLTIRNVPSPGGARPSDPALPQSLFLSFLLVGALLRFFDLTHLSQWPLTDEAKSGYFALELAEHGGPRMLYDFSQLPPFYIWLQALCFRWLGVSLFSLWALPAFLSTLSLPLAYGAARAWGSRAFAQVFTLLMALGFWPLYTGRFSHPGNLLLLWELGLLWALGAWLQKTRPTAWAWRIGLLTGAGFYTFTSWPTVAAGALGLVLWKRRSSTPLFLLGMGLAAAPWVLALATQDYGGYLGQVRVLDPLHPTWAALGQGASDLAALFWRSVIPTNLFAYRPFWGGYLNPVLSALFFTGAVLWIGQKEKKAGLAAAVAFLLFYGPGFLTGGVEMFRVLPLLPLVLGGVAWGWTGISSGLRAPARVWVLSGFLLFSLGLDCHHLFRVYRDLWTAPLDNWFASKSIERLRAFGILDRVQKEMGPGWVLGELTPDLYDQSLTLAVQGFNVEGNGRLDRSKARWAALLTNVHYQPTLSKLFPEGRWVWLSPDVGRPDGGMALVVLPVPGSHPEILNRWIAADRACHAMVPLVFERRDYRSRGPVLDRLAALYPLFQGDRFLESCYWEKVAENHYGDRDWEGQVEALRTAVQKGIPAAHLYNSLGALYLRKDHLKEAKSDLEKAVHCPLDLTSAQAGLKALKEREKGRSLKD